MHDNITKEHLMYIKAHVRFLNHGKHRQNIAIHPLDQGRVWQMHEDLNSIHNGALATLGTNLNELTVLMHDLDELLSSNVNDRDC